MRAASNIGLAMVFILLAYGGWNELSYISGDMKDVRRNMARVLVLGVIVVTVLYLLVNWAYMSVFGLAGLRKTFTPAADLVGQAFGPAGATVTALIVCAMALSTINASIFTGGRTSYALGRSFPLFGALGAAERRAACRSTPCCCRARSALGLMALGSTHKERLRVHGRLHGAGVLAVHDRRRRCGVRAAGQGAGLASARSRCRSIRSCRRCGAA